MGQLLVRELDLEVVAALKSRAAKHGHSAEAEHREILIEALLGPKKKTFAQALAAMPNVGLDSDFERIEESIESDVFD